MTYDEVITAVEENLKAEFKLSDEVDVLVQHLDLKKDGKLDKEEISQAIQKIREEYEHDDHDDDHSNNTDEGNENNNKNNTNNGEK